MDTSERLPPPKTSMAMEMPGVFPTHNGEFPLPCQFFGSVTQRLRFIVSERCLQSLFASFTSQKGSKLALLPVGKPQDDFPSPKFCARYFSAEISTSK